MSGMLLLAACALSSLEKTLSPDHREFLSRARYTISKEERKIFLNLPLFERDTFIEDFWKKRDSDPDTDVNEFKTQYFERIEDANRLFSAAGAPGWLQDRGRIYILLGPPDNRETYPRGRSLYTPPSEIWYYGMFPIYFVDHNWTDDYILEPLSAMQIALINEAQMGRKPQFPKKKGGFDFSLDVRRTKPDQILVRAIVPYKQVWFLTEEGVLKTTFKVTLEITELDEKQQEKGKVREERRDFPLLFKEKDWLELAGKSYVMEFSVSGLPQGTYSLLVQIRNAGDGSLIYKKHIFTL